MKRVIALLIVFFVLAGSAGCSRGDTAADDKPPFPLGDNGAGCGVTNLQLAKATRMDGWVLLSRHTEPDPLAIGNPTVSDCRFVSFGWNATVEKPLTFLAQRARGGDARLLADELRDTCLHPTDAAGRNVPAGDAERIGRATLCHLDPRGGSDTLTYGSDPFTALRFSDVPERHRRQADAALARLAQLIRCVRARDMYGRPHQSPGCRRL
jgi:hypothetical protein